MRGEHACPVPALQGAGGFPREPGELAERVRAHGIHTHHNTIFTHKKALMNTYQITKGCSS